MTHTEVKVYATTTCPYCAKVVAWLTSKNIPFVKILVDKNEQAAMEMIYRTGQRAVPVTEIVMKDGSSEYVIGFNEPRLASTLGI